MAITNHERVGKAMDLLKEGLAPFIEREFVSVYKKAALDEAKRFVADDRLNTNRPLKEWDAAALLRLMWDAWNDVFRKTLGQGERSLVSELREVRKKWAHQEPFTGDDADRALDSTERLLTAVSAPQSEGVRKLKMELRRLIVDEQVRSERRKSTGTTIESQTTGTLKPWREVITPHKDVASGHYQQAEFAADLWQVHLAPKFQRTRGVLRLMAAVIHRLWEKGDKNPLILPSMIPIDDFRVRDELTRYLTDNWKPIIEKDVDGPNSLSLRIDSEVPNLGKFHATRRVARTIYLGSAPMTSAAHRGIEDRRVKLGCVMPGESPDLSALMNSSVEITLEIKADVPEGVPDSVVRTVTENCRTLKFKSHGFEEK